jgi:hypothetical protein
MLMGKTGSVGKKGTEGLFNIHATLVYMFKSLRPLFSLFSIFPLTLALSPTGGEGILVEGSYTKAFGKLGAAQLTYPLLQRLLQPARHIPQ